MKKISLLLITLLMLITLVACGKPVDKHAVIFDELKIEFFTNEENNNNVLNDLTLPNDSKKYPEAFVYWDSSNFNVVEISGNQGLINRQEEDETVLLLIFITIDNIKKSYSYEITVIGLEVETVIPEDPDKTQYRVDFYANDKRFKTFYIEENNHLIFPDNNPKALDKIFRDWYYNNEVIDSNFIVTKNMKIYGVFDDLNTHQTKTLTNLTTTGLDGISYINFDISKTGKQTETIEVIINEEIKTYQIKNQKTLLIDGINLIGEYELEIIVPETITLSNIIVGNNTIENLVYLDIYDSRLLVHYYQDETFKFVKKAPRGSVIEYRVKEVDKEYILVKKNQIKIIPNTLYETTITIAATYENIDRELEFELTLGVPELTLLKDLEYDEEGKVYLSRGLVTGYYSDQLGMTVFLEDDSFNGKVISSHFSDIEVGNYIEFIGVVYNEEIHVQEVKRLSRKAVNKSLLLSLNNIEDLENKFVHIEGIVTSNVTNNRFNIYLDNEITVLVKNNHYQEISKGYYLETSGFVEKIDDEYFLVLIPGSVVETTKLSKNIIINNIMAFVNLNELITYPIMTNFPLPTSDPIFNSSISWESSHPEYFSSDGTYTKPAKDIEGTMTATFTLDGELLGVRTIKIIIKK